MGGLGVLPPSREWPRCARSSRDALDLADATHTTAKFWMNLQTTWDLAQATKKRRAA